MNVKPTGAEGKWPPRAANQDIPTMFDLHMREESFLCSWTGSAQLVASFGLIFKLFLYSYGWKKKREVGNFYLPT